MNSIPSADELQQMCAALTRRRYTDDGMVNNLLKV